MQSPIFVSLQFRYALWRIPPRAWYWQKSKEERSNSSMKEHLWLSAHNDWLLLASSSPYPSSEWSFSGFSNEGLLSSEVRYEVWSTTQLYTLRIWENLNDCRRFVKEPRHSSFGNKERKYDFYRCLIKVCISCSCSVSWARYTCPYPQFSVFTEAVHKVS